MLCNSVSNHVSRFYSVFGVFASSSVHKGLQDCRDTVLRKYSCRVLGQHSGYCLGVLFRKEACSASHAVGPA